MKIFHTQSPFTTPSAQTWCPYFCIFALTLTCVQSVSEKFIVGLYYSCYYGLQLCEFFCFANFQQQFPQVTLQFKVQYVLPIAAVCGKLTIVPVGRV